MKNPSLYSLMSGTTEKFPWTRGTPSTLLGRPLYFEETQTYIREKKYFIRGLLRVVCPTLSKLIECTWSGVRKDTAGLAISKTTSFVLIISSSLVDWAGSWLGNFEISSAPLFSLPVRWSTLKLNSNILSLRLRSLGLWISSKLRSQSIFSRGLW